MIQELIYRAAIAFPWILGCTYLMTHILVIEPLMRRKAR